MKRIVIALATAMVLAGVFQAVSAAQVREIESHGTDGDGNYYTIHCSNGAESSVTIFADPPKVCSNPVNGREHCRRNWKLESAAAHACR